jgi:hypothetical protein
MKLSECGQAVESSAKASNLTQGNTWHCGPVGSPLLQILAMGCEEIRAPRTGIRFRCRFCFCNRLDRPPFPSGAAPASALSMNTAGAPSTDPTDMLRTMTVTHPDEPSRLHPVQKDLRIATNLQQQVNVGDIAADQHQPRFLGGHEQRGIKKQRAPPVQREPLKARKRSGQNPRLRPARRTSNSRRHLARTGPGSR